MCIFSIATPYNTMIQISYKRRNIIRSGVIAMHGYVNNTYKVICFMVAYQYMPESHQQHIKYVRSQNLMHHLQGIAPVL